MEEEGSIEGRAPTKYRSRAGINHAKLPNGLLKSMVRLVGIAKKMPEFDRKLWNGTWMLQEWCRCLAARRMPGGLTPPPVAGGKSWNC